MYRKFGVAVGRGNVIISFNKSHHYPDQCTDLTHIVLCQHILKTPSNIEQGTWYQYACEGILLLPPPHPHHSSAVGWLPRNTRVGTLWPQSCASWVGYGYCTNCVTSRIRHTQLSTWIKISPGLTMNLVSPLERVSVTNPMDSKWLTTSWRSLGWRRRMEKNEWDKDKSCRSWQHTMERYNGEGTMEQVQWRRVLPASQSQRCSLDVSAKYQYHHSRQHLEIMNMWIYITTPRVWTPAIDWTSAVIITKGTFYLSCNFHRLFRYILHQLSSTLQQSESKKNICTHI